MHWIQTYILEQLLFADSLRNRDMRPPKVESNLYQYHLKQLVKECWLEKVGAQYTLAPKGLAWADRYSSQLRAAREQSKVISIVIITNNNGEYLLLPRLRQPFVGYLTLPSGKVKKGEPIATAARRELHEKAGINNIDLQFRGTFRSIVQKGSQVITDYIGFIWFGQINKPLSQDNAKNAAWISLDDLRRRSSVFPGALEILTKCIKGTTHHEAVIDLD